MLDAGSRRHPRKQLRGTLILDPVLRPVDKGVVDVMVWNGGADRVQMSMCLGQDRLSADANSFAFRGHLVAQTL